MPTPPPLEAIWRDTNESGFTMPSDHQAGALLRTLSASRPGARILELGTGTGLSAAWILDGMDSTSTLDSVDNDAAVSAIAQRHLGGDNRLRLHVQDAADFLAEAQAEHYDLVFADAWPGKYSCLEHALGALKVGGLYVVDDMLPQPNWPEGHDEKAEALSDTLRARGDLRITEMAWSTGVLIASKVA